MYVTTVTISQSFSAIEARLDDGNYLVIYHAQYSYVTQGQSYSPGALLGQVGAYGNATGCHIHFEIDGPNHAVGHFQDWTDVDPWSELEWNIRSLAFAPVDFDGDGKADLAVWRPSNATWYILQSSSHTDREANWGALGDYVFAQRFLQDSAVDLGYWHPADGTWHIALTGGRYLTQQWGSLGDIPVPGTYGYNPGGPVMDLAVWRQSNGTWYFYDPTNSNQSSVVWGQAGDIPVPGQYDVGGYGPRGGPTEVAVWRPSTGVWWILNSGRGTSRTVQWGQVGDIPVPGDYDGDGITDLAIFRPSTATWWILNSSDGSVRTAQWGTVGDIPVPGDYDHVFHTEMAVFRPQGGIWYVYNGPGGQWGTTGDRPV
jgi:hypothetical protein